MPRADLGGITNTTPARRAIAGGIALALAGSLQAATNTPSATISTASTLATPNAPRPLPVTVASKSGADDLPEVAAPRRFGVPASRAAARPTAQHPTARPRRLERRTVRRAVRRAVHPRPRPVHRHPVRRHPVHRHPVRRHVVPAPRQHATGGAAVVIAFALRQVGKAYRWGSAGPDVFDCSGLVLAAYSRVGIGLPHGTGGILRHGRPVGRGQLRPGDIVFLTAGHVAIYLGGGRIVEAANARAGVRLTTLWGFWSARRVL